MKILSEGQKKALAFERDRFIQWWRVQTRPNGPRYGCSENWGAWQAWQKATLGEVLDDE